MRFAGRSQSLTFKDQEPLFGWSSETWNLYSYLFSWGKLLVFFFLTWGGVFLFSIRPFSDFGDVKELSHPSQNFCCDDGGHQEMGEVQEAWWMVGNALHPSKANKRILKKGKSIYTPAILGFHVNFAGLYHFSDPLCDGEWLKGWHWIVSSSSAKWWFAAKHPEKTHWALNTKQSWHIMGPLFFTLRVAIRAGLPSWVTAKSGASNSHAFLGVEDVSEVHEI